MTERCSCKQLSEGQRRAPGLQDHVNIPHRVSPASVNVPSSPTPSVYQGKAPAYATLLNVNSLPPTPNPSLVFVSISNR
ncbi:hypothetical protein VTI28DRAFT_10584 [Corynascus sepedonium]